MSDKNTFNEDLKCGVYRHYKGKYYLLIGIARHSETEELHCVYVPLYTILGRGGLSIRPLSMWNDVMNTPEGFKKRFEFVRTI